MSCCITLGAGSFGLPNGAEAKLFQPPIQFEYRNLERYRSVRSSLAKHGIVVSPVFEGLEMCQIGVCASLLNIPRPPQLASLDQPLALTKQEQKCKAAIVFGR